MSTETELRDAFAEVGAQAPVAGPIFDRIIAGSRLRRRNRRIAHAAGVCAAVAAIVIPGSLWLTRSAPAPSTDPGDVATIDFTPGWLPAGFVETERNADPAGRIATRVFGKGEELIMVTDGAARDDTWQRGTPVVIAGRRGMITSSKADIGAELQVPGRSGRLLEVSITGSDKVGLPGARAIAIRIANSIRSTPVTVDIPLTCSDSMCRARGVDVGGARDKWEATVVGPGGHASLTYGYGGPPSDVNREQNITINGRPAVLWQAGMSGAGVYVDLGGKRSIMVATQMRRGLTPDEAIRIAKSVRLTSQPDYSWLGTRPY